MRTKTIGLIGMLIVFTLLMSPVGLQSSFARTGTGTADGPAVTEAAADLGVSETGLYIVQLTDASLASYDGGISGLAPTTPRATGERRLDPTSAASQAYLNYLEGKQASFISQMEATLGRPVEVEFQYLSALNGMAVRVEHAEAVRLMGLDGVKAVYPDTLRELETDVGPIHIGAPAIWNGDTLTGFATRGEGVIIGVIDSGINSQHPSFAATDGDGYTHTNPYGSGVYHGWCDTNPGFCNDKLIGAYGLNPNGGSPEDVDGHGSHTASTSGGNAHDAIFTVGSDPYDIRIQGVSPRSNIVAYKVCNPSCPSSASVAAVNLAIGSDMVDVLNYSISGNDFPWNDPVDLAFLEAFNAGIFVSASAGNSGPGPSTVAKTGPWNASVGASTINRIIANTFDITGPTTPVDLQGIGVVPGEAVNILTDITAPISYDPTNLTGCTPFAAGTFTGEIALIQRGGCTFATKQANAGAAGAVAVVVFNNVGGPPISMGGTVASPPAVFMDLAQGTAVKAYIDANPTATARINASTSLVYDDSWEDIMAGFSSRGPSQYELVKPDYVAPGVNILAAVATSGGDPVQYGFYQGTSMSSPHGAGSAALMVALYPSWSPAEIKSALATGAVPDVLLKEDGVTPANAFDQGSGLLNLAASSNVGLVFDETYDNYVNANPATGGDPKTLNQPSMVSYECNGTCTWVRTVRSVMTDTVTYQASFSSDVAIDVTVTPDQFSIAPGATQVLTITADVTGLPNGVVAFASVHLDPGLAPVSTPFSFADGAGDPALAAEEASAAAAPGQAVPAPLTDWEAPTAVLYDNGPLVNSPGTGVGGADESVLQSVSLGMNTLGFGHQVVNGNWVADDFTVSDAEGWTIDAFTFFAYQTGSPTTSTMTSVNWILFDGDPSAGGSVIAAGSGLDTTGWTNIYRVSETTTGTATNRPIMYSTVGLGGGYLPQGTYWLAWQTDGTLASGPWAPPVTINGQASTGNGLQSTDNGATWAPALDSGTGTPQQGLPFIIEGTVGGIAGPAGQQLPMVVIPAALNPDIEVDPASMTANQAANTTTQQTLTISNIGTGDLDWTIDEDNSPASSLAISGTAPDYSRPVNPDAGFARSGLSGDSVTPVSSVENPLVMITHSTSQTITPLNSVACSGDGGVTTTDNQYLRAFDLNSFGIFGDFTVTSLEFGVEEASSNSGSQSLTVNIYEWDGVSALTYGNLSLVGTNTISLSDQNLTLVNVPVNATISAGMSLVAEVALQDTTGTAAFFIGSNSQGQTGPSYLASASCGLANPTDVAAIGQGQMMMVMNVYGDEAASPLCDAPDDIPWLSVSPAAGTTPEGTSTDVTVTFDSTGLSIGTYDAALCVNSNDAATPLVPVPVTLNVQQDPAIEVSPAALNFNVPGNSTDDDTLTIGNTGSGDLIWDIFEDASAAAPLGNLWSDNFDSYPTGQNLHGVGGWKGWNNDPTFTAFTTSAQAQSSPNSVDIVGNADLVQEYSVSSGQLIYTAHQYIPSGFSGQTYFIMLNQYDDAGATNNWSVQVNFDSSTGQLTNDGPAGGSMPYKTNQWVEIRVEIDLDADMQSFYYDNTLLFTGSWSGGMSGGGITSIGAVDLFANGASSVYYDDMSLYLVPVSCDAPEDIPWLSVSPTSGTTGPGSSDDVTVSVDTTGLSNGTYTASLCVTSNDPVDPVVEVPVTLNVGGYEIYLPLIARDQ